MDGLHIQGMTENKVDTDIITKVSYPVPAVHAFNPRNDVSNIGFKQLNELVRVCRYFFVYKRFALLIKNAGIEESSMQIDTAVVWMAVIMTMG